MAVTLGTLSALDLSKNWTSCWAYELLIRGKWSDERWKEAFHRTETVWTDYSQATEKLSDSLQLHSLMFDELVMVLNDYYDPKLSVIVQRFKFNWHIQAEGETITQYVVTLCKISTRNSVTIWNMLGDRFKCEGILHGYWQLKSYCTKRR